MGNRRHEDELTRINYDHMHRALQPMTAAERAEHTRAWLADMERFVGTCHGARAAWLDEMIAVLRRAAASSAST